MIECWGVLPGMRKDMTGAAAQPAVVTQAQRARAQSSAGSTHSTANVPDPQECPSSSVSLEPAAAGAHLEHAGHPGASATQSKGVDIAADSSSEDNSSTTSGSDDDEGDDTSRLRPAREAVDPEALKAARKAHKADVKETNRERRKQKMKKHVKKRAVNKHKHK